MERQLKNRFPIGSHVSEQRIVQDFLKQVKTRGIGGREARSACGHHQPLVLSSQNYSERAIQTVVHIMLRRGELQHRMQRKVLFRIR